MTSTASRPRAPVHLADVGSLACRIDPADRELFDHELRSWMPPGAYDVHAHLYDLRMLVPQSDDRSFEGPAQVGFATYQQHQRAWMGDRAPAEGLFFPFPARGLNTEAANAYLHAELGRQPASRGLMIITPRDDPARVESLVAAEGWRGFKVYHLFADRTDTFHAEAGEYIPEWAWELAHARGLVIMLHIVLNRALADERNQAYIVDRCLRHHGARLVLAHAGRGFCAAHTVRGIEALRGLPNVWFDTSAVCEPAAFEAIVRVFGATRLMYGSDFPVSEVRGKALSLGDGFWWLYGHEQNWSGWPLGKPAKVGLESLLALKQACRATCLSDGDVERIFSGNARQLVAEPDASPARWPAAAGRGAAGRGVALYREARGLIPGGTQLLSKRPEMFAPEQWPAYYSQAIGCEIIDLDGRRYFDFTHNGVGACLLGYAHPRVTAAVVRRVLLGSMCSLNSADEVQLARVLLAMHPWAQQARFARGGGEALAIAARIARAATGRDLVALCGYHGWSDWYLAANLHANGALDGHLLPGLSPAGVPRGLRGTALPFAYNELEQLERIVNAHPDRLAAVIMEPTRNTPPASGFLEGVREVCNRCRAKLIFDEVTTGFRLRRGGAHLDYGVEPDAAVFAKALGNGHPIAAVIGKRDTMEAAQETFISSTYWTEGVGAVAALATLEVHQEIDVPGHARQIGELFRQGCAQLAARHGLPLLLWGYPALTTLAFAHPGNAALVTLLTVRMLDRGFLVSNGFYPTLAHQPWHVEAFLAAADEVFHELAESIEHDDAADRIGGPVKHGGFARLT
jgi:glutamate-1-semialdehyde 2,1-aminomutase